MKYIYLAYLGIVCLSCQTLIKDEPEIEKVIEDGTKEIVKDVIENG